MTSFEEKSLTPNVIIPNDKDHSDLTRYELRN
jgi:hypothetical protein